MAEAHNNGPLAFNHAYSSAYLDMRSSKQDNVVWTRVTLRTALSPAAWAGIAQRLECRTRAWKVAGSSPCRSGGRKCFPPGSIFCADSYFGNRSTPVTSVARKRSRSFCQKCRWQVAAKHAYTLPMWLWIKWHCKVVHVCMVHRKQAPSHATTKQRCQYITSVDIKTTRHKWIVTHSESHPTWAQRVCSRAENNAMQKWLIIIIQRGHNT